jgi:hypothetical protein
MRKTEVIVSSNPADKNSNYMRRSEGPNNQAYNSLFGNVNINNLQNSQSSNNQMSASSIMMLREIFIQPIGG